MVIIVITIINKYGNHSNNKKTNMVIIVITIINKYGNNSDNNNKKYRRKLRDAVLGLSVTKELEVVFSPNLNPPSPPIPTRSSRDNPCSGGHNEHSRAGSAEHADGNP